MDQVEQAVRALGRVIQADTRYQAYQAAKAACDDDTALQAAIRQYQQTEVRYQQELQRLEDGADPEALETLEQTAQQAYAAIVQNPHMQAYDAAKQAFDALVQQTYGILQLCLKGEDPNTCTPPAGCGGDCHSCGGCASMES